MVLTGRSAAPGVTVGSIFIYNEKKFIPGETFISADESCDHYARYLSIKEQAKNELEEIRLSMQKVDPHKAEIFKAHQEIADDIIINDEINARILIDFWAGDWAIYNVYETVMTMLAKTNDIMISQRAADFNDVRALLLRLWYGQKFEGLSNLKEPVIIAANELLPSDTACLDKENVLAILTETGGETSHTAIIAKSYGIPAILSIDGLLDTVKQGQQAAVNAAEGTVFLDPSDDVKIEFYEKINELMSIKEEALGFLEKEAYTSCGVKVDIGLNISGVSEEELKPHSYTDSVGLFRTEFLYMGRNTLPSEEEQFEVYKKILENYGEKPVIIRTLDIGADKKITSIHFKHEENPFLGIRGIRFCFDNPEIFITQIRAALRSSAFGNLWLMLPMIGSIDDIRNAKKIIEEVHDNLKTERIKTGQVKIGIMIEIPSIALISDMAAKEVDFASIGSNDLCQYLCAADKMNGAVANYYSKYHPAVFRLIKESITAFTDAGKPVSICGELGSDPMAVPVLLGLGLRKLSMGAASVAEVKRVIASVSLEKAKKIAQNALSFSTASGIEKYLKSFSS